LNQLGLRVKPKHTATGMKELARAGAARQRLLSPRLMAWQFKLAMSSMAIWLRSTCAA
jgi:hypothetical protein